MKKIIFLYVALVIPLCGFCQESGKFINPISDICWECLFPITVSGMNVTPGHKDLTTHNKVTCVCAGIPPKVGIPITFWEPAKLVDVTKHPYKFLGLGGISLGQDTIRNRGTVGIIADGPSQASFFHVHWYSYPILSLLELFTDFSCVEKNDMDILYMSELDPLWNDDQLSIIVHPEALLFANPAAQLACAADCTGASFSKPLDKLFWCAGCEGSLYPLNGTVGHHLGAIQASALIVNRIIAKMHRIGLQNGYEENEFCFAKPMPIIKKSLYKTQLAYPVPQTQGPCHALGSSDLLWGAGKSYPKGEDFVYLIWTKKQCCLDAVKPAIMGTY